MPSAANNTIRRSEQELRALLDELDRHDAASGSAKRAHARVEFRRAFVPIELTNADRQRIELVMACRNISSGGMSLLHSSFVYNGTRARVKLRHGLRGEIYVSGEVVRCSHVRGHIHEVGLRFDEPVEVQAFADMDRLAQQYSVENVKAEALVGRIVVLADNVVLTRIVQHYLRETGLAIGYGDTLEASLETIDPRTKIVLVDHDVESKDPLELFPMIEEKQPGVPVLVLSADTRPATREQLREAGVSGFLKKPLEEKALLQGLAEFILPGVKHGASDGRVRSSLPSDSPLRPLVDSFLNDLRGIGKEITDALAQDDVEAFIRACNRIQGTAPSLGFESIADLAADTLNSVNSTMSLAENREAVGKLVSQCDRAAA